MRTYRLTPKAQADLEHIWDYSQKNWGISQAEIYVQAIRRTLEALVEGAIIPQPAEHIRKNYLKTPVGSHIVFFRQDDHGIEVIRILHQRMDTSRL